ncbi:hypothetical protein A2482_00625 [Candidatus Falkowbacteria bacterium RIFOXYC2_FULL_48_21]|uniref:Uncharacterized protein n=1 Tax=Candidatus Falkowbacteria bacterium RIFOXYC2_FULL_48_21 TaxID=1798005 RepID=A0A1F5T6D6_9BACT|nr:MAG: hypothetical protein A2482_00625 [Candidatus Falkowbacteria bacterium RIFOXYC2_FULL_48_21]
MMKKIIWLIIVVGVALVAIYIKFGYNGSQFQLRNSFRYVEAFPVEHFQNATEKSCGIWYESGSGDALTVGKENHAVKECFKEAFAGCSVKNVLLVKDQSESVEKKITYSLIRILRKNDLSECLIQNYYEEVNLASPDAAPLSYINTCTVLADEIDRSCEPFFVKEARQSKLDVGPTLNVE